MTKRRPFTARLARVILAAVIGFLAAFSSTLPLSGQSPGNGTSDRVGRIVGRVVDAQTGKGLVSVAIRVADAGIGTISGLDGRYVLEDVPAGNVALRVETLGFAPKVVTNITVPSGGAVEQNVTLEPAAIELMALTDRFSAKLDAKNFLDEPYEITQGDVPREYYRVGRSLSFGLSWKR